MDIERLTEEDWAEMERLHPGTLAFIMHRSLIREHEALQKKEHWGYKFTAYEAERYAELKDWAAATAQA